MRTDYDPAAPSQENSELWSLREDVSVEAETDDGPVLLRGRWGDVTVQRPSRLAREVLSRMRLGPISLENAIGTSHTAQRAELYRLLDRLQPLIVRSLRLPAGEPLLSVVPLTPRSRFSPRRLAPDIPVRMSVFAGLWTDGNGYRIDSPLATHRILLHRTEAVMLVASLAAPVTPAALAAGAAAHEIVADALAYLAAAGVVVQAQGAGAGRPVFHEDADPALTGWSPADLTFHTRSTVGRHDEDFGVTYPTGQTAPAEPVIKPRQAEHLDLYRPRWQDLCRKDPPLTVAMEGRRSLRSYGTEAIGIAELGELLYRTARVRSLIPVGGYQLSDRPYPSGGACYELELYITVQNCAGLAPGVYHYDPLGHRLEPLGTERKAMDELLGCAKVAAAMDDPPPLLISMTARFHRLSWKYEGLAYRLALQHVGVLTQSLYLICTAMRLAPCALGSVNIEVAARAFGTDWRTEPCVGQFIVGREPGDIPLRGTGSGQNVNNAEWADLARGFRK